MQSIVPYNQRKTTDISVLLFFILFILVFLSLFALAIFLGNPRKLTHGVDYEGNICLHQEPYTAWPHPHYYNLKICVSDCKATTNDPRMALTYKSEKFLTYCIPKIFSNNYTGLLESEDFINFFPYSNFFMKNVQSKTNNWSDKNDFSDQDNLFSQVMGDLYLATPVIILSFFVTILIAYLYAMSLNSCSNILIWGSLFLAVASGFGISYILLSDASQASESISTARSIAMSWLGWIIFTFSIIILIMIIALAKRIQIAVSITREASKAIISRPILLLLPFIYCFTTLIFFAICHFRCISNLYLFSITKEHSLQIPEEIVSSSSTIGPGLMVVQEWRDDLRSLFAINVFAIIWILQFLLYFVFSLISLIVADWYFLGFEEQNEVDGIYRPTISQRSDDYHRIGSGHIGIKSAFNIISHYHIGSIAFASLILAFCEFLRYLLNYIDKRIKQSQNIKCQRCLFNFFQSCLRCLETTLDKIAKPALIYTVIYGTPFWESSLTTFNLLMRHLSSVAAINLVGDTLMFIGKILIASITSISAALFLNYFPYYEKNLSSLVMPVLVIFILAYTISSLFMILFESCIDTMFFCFLLEEDSGAEFSSDRFRQLVNDHLSESERQAKIKKTRLSGNESYQLMASE